ncbi:unnamed protein product [Adineta steineri]|uniref:Uncharacterized protein n=2 Tax=Adineta steineri TaxID=433720 RepID=A0A814KGP7_9BILA|nr:unnamed protein product [Adineta steineri]
MTNINVIEAVRSYINRMIEDCGPTIKGLVMDKETASIVSMVYAQSEILQKEVFLFERIDIPGQKSLKHLSAICFLRPTEENIQSLTFIENYPQFKKLSGTVSKHVTIVSELSRLVGLYHLLEVSETEQHLVCQGDHNEVVQKIKRLIKDDKIRDLDILRLLSLYALRYEQHASNELNTLKHDAQKHRRFSEKYTQYLQAIVEYGGLKFRQADLFNTQTPMAITRQFIRGLRGVDNVYAQHVPLIKDLIEQLLRGKLKDTSYPNVNAKDQVNQQNLLQQGQINKPSEIIVYVVGGVTYEESYHIQMMNKQSARILLGGSYIHNFSTFIDEVLNGVSSSLSSASNELLSSRRR